MRCTSTVPDAVGAQGAVKGELRPKDKVRDTVTGRVRDRV